MTNYAAITCNLAAHVANQNRGKSQLDKRMEKTNLTADYRSELFYHVFELWGGSAFDGMLPAHTALYLALEHAEKHGSLPHALHTAQEAVMKERQDFYKTHPVRTFIARKLNTRAYRQSLGEF